MPLTMLGAGDKMDEKRDIILLSRYLYSKKKPLLLVG